MVRGFDDVDGGRRCGGVFVAGGEVGDAHFAEWSGVEWKEEASFLKVESVQVSWGGWMFVVDR